MSADENPAPWRWESCSDPDDWCLVDADGLALIDSTNSGTCIVPSPYVRAVTERAPEMEALLREHMSYEDPREYATPGSTNAKTRALLAEIDKARGDR